MKNAGDLDGALKGKDSDYMELQKRYSELQRGANLGDRFFEKNRVFLYFFN